MTLKFYTTQASTLARRRIIFCAVSITCTTDAALLVFNHSYRERIHTLVHNANPQRNLNPAALIREQFIYEATRNRHESGWNGAMEKL